jgi:hypothetical protein
LGDNDKSNLPDPEIATVNSENPKENVTAKSGSVRNITKESARVKVCLRIRPFIEREIISNAVACFESDSDNKKVIFRAKQTQGHYSYNIWGYRQFFYTAKLNLTLGVS